MQTTDQSTEGKDPQQTMGESSLDGADCSPSSIYLQVFGDSEDTETPIPPKSWREVTWSKDRVFIGDVRYVRWDLVKRLLLDVMQIHADPNDAGHNQCDEDKCQWCEWASELFPENDERVHPYQRERASIMGLGL